MTVKEKGRYNKKPVCDYQLHYKQKCREKPSFNAFLKALNEIILVLCALAECRVFWARILRVKSASNLPYKPAAYWIITFL